MITYIYFHAQIKLKTIKHMSYLNLLHTEL